MLSVRSENLKNWLRCLLASTTAWAFCSCLAFAPPSLAKAAQAALPTWEKALTLALSVGTHRRSAAESAEMGVGGGASATNAEAAAEILADATDGTMADALAGVQAAYVEAADLSEFLQPQMLIYSAYKIKSGDMISFLALDFGLNQDTLISVNNITNTRYILPGKYLKVPNQDGVLHTVSKGETAATLARRYNVDEGAIRVANELFSGSLTTGATVFIPGGKLDALKLQEINGDLFIWPVRGRLTSPYGYRTDPFTGKGRTFHTGIDIAAPRGTPIRAAMAGRVVTCSYNETFGNYIIIAHHSDYRTLYGHLNAIRTKAGAYVRTGDIIGEVGSTGLSTGPHLHFTVYKNGVLTNPRRLMN